MQQPDLVTPVLGVLRDYQFSLETPKPDNGSFDRAAARRGRAVFNGAGRCATCHETHLYTDINRGLLHDPSETGMDPAYAHYDAFLKLGLTDKQKSDLVEYLKSL